MKKKMRKSTWVALAFFVYISATAAYLLPRNGAISITEKWITLICAYLIVALLWWTLHRKEQRKEHEHKRNE